MITVIDGNFLFYRACKVDYIDSQYPKRESIVRKFVGDVIYATKHLSNKNKTNKCVLVVDSKSWRKESYTEYKANRDHSDIDFSIYDDCLEAIKHNDICEIHKLERAEGDDLITLYKEYCAIKKEPLMIVSIDGDMKQLLSLNPLVFILSEVPKYEKVFVPKGFSEMLKEQIVQRDAGSYILNIGRENKLRKDFDIINKFVEKKNVEEVDVNFMLWEKILVGDVSDNIPSVWRAEKGRKKKVDGEYLQKVLDIIGKDKTPEFYLNTNCEDLINAIKIVYNQPVLDRIGFIKNFERNYKLICLDSKNFPSVITENFQPMVSEKKIVSFQSIFPNNKPSENTFAKNSFDFVSNAVKPLEKSGTFILSEEDLSWLLD